MISTPTALLPLRLMLLPLSSVAFAPPSARIAVLPWPLAVKLALLLFRLLPLPEIIAPVLLLALAVRVVGVVKLSAAPSSMR
ncbi:hypothetical protein [Pantoea leporis]|uniref:hypothetical protein n=1 Tax=Pantoea leporis TaxID=2933780 RepID=UPI0023036594|nr:hypothetical protein [Pantoea leporis]